MKYTMLKDCETCNGEKSSHIPETDEEFICPTCKGTGKISAEISAEEIRDNLMDIKVQGDNFDIAEKEYDNACNQTFITSSDFSNNIAKILERIDDAIIEIERVLHIRKENLMSEEEANLQLEIRTLEKAKQLILEMVEVKDD